MSKKHTKRVICSNRRARYDYHILDTLEVGIVLTGTEIKSIRHNDVNINDSYAECRAGGVVWINGYIPEFKQANRFNHYPRRERYLLLNKREIKKLLGKTKDKGLTLIPLSLYLNEKNYAKLEIGLCKGKKEYDKRQSIKEAEWQRDKARLLAN